MSHPADPGPTDADPVATATETADSTAAATGDGVAVATVGFEVDGRAVEVPDAGGTLLDALREVLGIRSVKDGCAPQGQCGCCTVLVDGAPRVACVTPVRRVKGRSITTVDGLAPAVREVWADAFAATGASQCGFCTPGIICRLEGARTKGAAADDRVAVDRALAAHLCRCTGWQPIVEAWADAVSALPSPPARLGTRSGPAGGTGAGTDAGTGLDPGPDAGDGVDVGVPSRAPRDLAAASRRAAIEGGVPQRVGPDVALGRGGFADDLVPSGALVAMPDGTGGWVVGESVAEARSLSGKVQGRNTTVDAVPPLDAPDGAWDAVLRTCWVEPGYLEPDAAWCEPGGEPIGPLLNGGAFGAKQASVVAAAARDLADRWRRPVRVLLAREDVVRLGPKRPPVAGGATADGRGVLRVVATPGIEGAVAAMAPGLLVEPVEVPGPPTDASIRAAGWAEAVVLLAGARGAVGPLVAPSGGRAEVELRPDGSVHVVVDAGDPLDEVVLRSYCVGAVHQALSWIRSEGIAVDADGAVQDLTIRSFGILKASDMPPVEVDLRTGDGPPVNGSDAVFAATAAAAWIADGRPPDLPTRR